MRVSDARVLIVATDGFEEWELFGPRQILQEKGAEVVLASLKRDPIQATVHDDPGQTIRPDLTIDEANADDFDALVLPGGVRNPDQLRLTARGFWLRQTSFASAPPRAGPRSEPTSEMPARRWSTSPR
jgi:protease I